MGQSNRITKGELLKLIWSRPVTSLAEEFGVSPNGLAKICDRLDIPRPPKGYWRSQSVEQETTVPSSIPGQDEIVEIGGKSHHKRKSRSRLPLEVRRKMILDEARRMALDEGVHEVSLRKIAGCLEMSEAQAHNIFATREDLLVSLAIEEVEAFEAERQKAVKRGGTRVAKVIMSSLTHLRQVSERGAVLQKLMRNSKIRARVDRERAAVRSEVRNRHIGAVVREKDFAHEEAFASVAILTSLVIRAGHLVSEEIISLAEAERLCLPVVMAAALERTEP